MRKQRSSIEHCRTFERPCSQGRRFNKRNQPSSVLSHLLHPHFLLLLRKRPIYINFPTAKVHNRSSSILLVARGLGLGLGLRASTQASASAAHDGVGILHSRARVRVRDVRGHLVCGDLESAYTHARQLGTGRCIYTRVGLVLTRVSLVPDLS